MRKCLVVLPSQLLAVFPIKGVEHESSTTSERAHEVDRTLGANAKECFFENPRHASQIGAIWTSELPPYDDTRIDLLYLTFTHRSQPSRPCEPMKRRARWNLDLGNSNERRIH